jgi:hypothetical protein
LADAKFVLRVLIGVWCVLWAAQPARASSRPIHRASAFPGSGWNTWDIERPNAMIHMPDGIAMEFSLYDPHTGSEHPVVIRNFQWQEDNVRFNISAKSSGHLVLYGFREGEKVRCVSPSRGQVAVSAECVIVAVDPGAKTVELLRDAR